MNDLAVVMNLDRHRQLQVDRYVRIGTHTNRHRRGAVDVVTTTNVAGTIGTIDVLRVTLLTDAKTHTAGDHHHGDELH